jgi:LuxR family maltose regulon positive regulatory protein
MPLEFGGSERTVAEDLLAEVLDRQSDQARRLLLRSSILERVNGELADLLTGGSGGERVLQRLEEAGALVVSLDAGRTWFRYHRLFADLLQLKLRGSDPAELPALHDAAAGWYAEHGHSVEAVRHARAARNWGLAARPASGTAQSRQGTAAATSAPPAWPWATRRGYEGAPEMRTLLDGGRGQLPVVTAV